MDGDQIIVSQIDHMKWIYLLKSWSDVSKHFENYSQKLWVENEDDLVKTWLSFICFFTQNTWRGIRKGLKTT